MTNTSPPNLGAVIINPNIRKAIYATFVIALVVAGAVQVAYGQGNEPEWLGATLRVLGYLGIPIGSLALANAPTAKHVAGPVSE